MRRGRPILALVLTAALLTPTTAAAATPVVSVDNTAGNIIASGAVVEGRSDPANALVTVRNGYHFWAAIDTQPPVGGAHLQAADVKDHVGGLWAAGGLIPPSATAAYSGSFDPVTGGSQAVRVHYDFTSAGGAAAIAGNLLTIIANGLGGSLIAKSPEALRIALKIVTDAPDYVAFARVMQGTPDVFEIVTATKVLLDSPTGRAAIKEALAGLHVIATDAQLVKVASVVGIMDGAWLVVDLLSASSSGHTDGTVTFSLQGQAPAATWIAPDAGAMVNTTKLALSARLGAGAPPAGVTFTIAWGSRSPVTACTAWEPAADGRWGCTADLAKLEVPPGQLTLGMEYVDATAAHSYVPDVERTVGYAPAPTTSWRWQTLKGEPLNAEGIVTDGSNRLVGVISIWWLGDTTCIDDVVGPESQPFGGLTLRLQDLRTGRLTESRPTTKVNIGANAVSLPDGRVLVVGQALNYTQTSVTRIGAAEIYDPSSNKWTPTTAPSAAGWTSPLLLDADHVAFIGGGTEPSQPAQSDRVDVLTVSTGKILTIARLPIRMAEPLLTLLGDGRILVVPVADGVKAAYLVNPKGGDVETLRAPIAGVWWWSAWPLPEGGAAVAATITEGGKETLVTTTISADGKKWGGANRTPLAWSASAIGHDAAGRAILAGGYRSGEFCDDKKYTARAIAIDPRNGEASKLPDLPEPGSAVWFALLPDGRIAAGPGWTPNARGTLVLGP